MGENNRAADLLAVDDEPGVLSALRRVLTGELDLEIETTTDPHEALANLERRPPRVLLTDFRMPHIDGVMLLREARRLAPDTVRILLTARAEQADIIDAINLGRIFRFVAKPWEREDLVGVVREALAARELALRPPAESFDAEQERRSLRGAVEAMRRVQRSLWPDGRLACAGGEAAALVAPCEHATGDYLDVLPAGGGRTAIFVGDVAGHGVEAALTGFALRALLRAGIADGDDLAATVERANRSLCADLQSGRFVTLFAALHDPEGETLSYVNAGHLPPLLLSGDGATELRGTGLPLGLARATRYGDARPVPFRAGDLLFGYTDGLTEARNGRREFFGIERAQGQLLRSPALPPAEHVARIRTAVAAFAGAAHLQDDLSLLVYRAAPAGAPQGVGAAVPTECGWKGENT